MTRNKSPFLQKTLPLMLLTSALNLVTACNSHDEITEPAIAESYISFRHPDAYFIESDERNAIVVEFDKAAQADGVIKVGVASNDLAKFTFEPAVVDEQITIPVSKGATSASITIFPVNNTVIDGAKEIDFTLIESTKGYRIGQNKVTSSVWIDDESNAVVNFREGQLLLDEADEHAGEVTIDFSHPAPGNGVVNIRLTATNAIYGTHYHTEPAGGNGMITLQVQPGDQSATFRIMSINDNLFNTKRTINYTIASVDGALEKGGIYKQSTEISDDEIKDKPKSYSTAAGQWGTKRTFSYNENGSLASVHWEQHTPGKLAGVYEYVYNEQGQLEKSIESPAIYTAYSYENGRIIKSERYVNNILKEFQQFGYDAQGNIGEVAITYRKPDGKYKLGLVFVYLYYNDGNLYKKMAYNPNTPSGETAENSDDYTLISTETYAFYSDAVNHFPLEIVPGKGIQKNLPGKYTFENDSRTLEYDFSYEFYPNGQQRSRTVKGETTYYEYY